MGGVASACRWLPRWHRSLGTRDNIYIAPYFCIAVKFSAVSPYNKVADIRLPDQIIVYDSTLRDGEQMPGMSFSLDQKVAIAEMLDEVGVHQIEAGFPAVSANVP